MVVKRDHLAAKAHHEGRAEVEGEDGREHSRTEIKEGRAEVEGEDGRESSRQGIKEGKNPRN